MCVFVFPRQPQLNDAIRLNSNVVFTSIKGSLQMREKETQIFFCNKKILLLTSQISLWAVRVYLIVFWLTKAKRFGQRIVHSSMQSWVKCNQKYVSRYCWISKILEIISNISIIQYCKDCDENTSKIKIMIYSDLVLGYCKSVL